MRSLRCLEPTCIGLAQDKHFCALLVSFHISSGRAALEAFRRSQSDVHINGSVRELVVEHCSGGCAVVQEQAPL
jgi:hypothetical protein